MAKKKFYYYVGVKVNDGMTLVTRVENAGRMCYWNDKLPPLELSKTYAEDIAMGLNLNFHSAVVIQSRFELTTHFLAIEKLPKSREDYSGADLKLLDAYERVMNFNNPFVFFCGQINAPYFTESMVISFDEEAVQKRFREVLAVLDMSYNEWRRSEAARMTEKELADLLLKKLTDDSLPVKQADYTSEDKKLIYAYEDFKLISLGEKTVVCCDCGVYNHRFYYPVVAQKRLKEALETLGMSYEEWQNCDCRNVSADELRTAMTDKTNKTNN